MVFGTAKVSCLSRCPTVHVYESILLCVPQLVEKAEAREKERLRAEERKVHYNRKHSFSGCGTCICTYMYVLLLEY